MNTKKRIMAAVLALLLVVTPIFAVYADNALVGGAAEGIESGATYMLKNVQTNMYLTLPGYFDVTDEASHKVNVYQNLAGVNNQYSRAVTVTYSNALGKYNISPLIFEHFLTGGIESNELDNVVYEQSETKQYNWIIVKVAENKYMLYDENGKVLESSGWSTGTVSSTTYTAAGNIRVADKNTSGSSATEFQQWTFERVTVSPHMLKNSEDVTKKNIGSGAEWLFQLSTDEMNSGYLSVTDAISSDTSIVPVKKSGNYVIARMNVSSNVSGYNEYAILKLVLSNGSNRYAVVQDAGTGNNDACITKPFFPLESSDANAITGPYLHNVTLDNGQEKTIILTFKSEISIVGDTIWTVEDPNCSSDNINDTPAAVFYEKDGLKVQSNNYAILTVKKQGVVIVTATNNNCIYKIAIVINNCISGVTYDYENVINASKDRVANMKYETAHVITNIDSTVTHWEAINQIVDIDTLLSGYNFTIIKTGASVFSSKVDGIPYLSFDYNAISSRGSVEHNIKLCFPKNHYRNTIEFGLYYIQNMAYTKDNNILFNTDYSYKYIQVDDEYKENYLFAEDAEMSLVKNDGSEAQWWWIEYLDNGYFSIVSYGGDYALTAPFETEEDTDIRVVQSTYDRNDIAINQQWEITLNHSGTYEIRNRAYGENQKILKNSDGELNVGIYDADECDEWLVQTVYIDNWITWTGDNSDLMGFWRESPSIYFEYSKDGKNAYINEEEYKAAFNQAIEIWENALGIELEIAQNKHSANIVVYVCTKQYFSLITGGGTIGDTVAGRTKLTQGDLVYKPCAVNGESNVFQKKIVEHKEVKIGIFDTTHSGILLTVMVHELGHALGYWGHSSDLSSVMYASVDDYSNSTAPTTEDIEFLAQIYKENNSLC